MIVINKVEGAWHGPGGGGVLSMMTAEGGRGWVWFSGGLDGQQITNNRPLPPSLLIQPLPPSHSQVPHTRRRGGGAGLFRRGRG